jgi:hypothetical protein
MDTQIALGVDGTIAQDGQHSGDSETRILRMSEYEVKHYSTNVSHHLSSENNVDWDFLVSLLPKGWEAKAIELGAFKRKRNLRSPRALLRLLLMHMAYCNSFRCSSDMAKSTGIATLSHDALSKRLRKSMEWLRWIFLEMSAAARAVLDAAGGLLLEAVDSTTLQRQGSKGTDFRMHACLDVNTSTFAAIVITDCHQGERLERTPLTALHIVLADRNYLRSEAVAEANKAGALVVTRIRWAHPAMTTVDKVPFHAIEHVASLKENEIGEWHVVLIGKKKEQMPGRVISARIPEEKAEKAKKQLIREAKKKQKTLDPKSLLACEFVMLFTTVPCEMASAADVLALYPYRWQIELAFKRIKSQHHIDKIPNRNTTSALCWIYGKLILIAMAEEMYRRAITPTCQPLEAVTQSESTCTARLNESDSSDTNLKSEETNRDSDEPKTITTKSTERTCRKQARKQRKSRRKARQSIAERDRNVTVSIPVFSGVTNEDVIETKPNPDESKTVTTKSTELSSHKQTRRPRKSHISLTPWHWNSVAIGAMQAAIGTPRTLADLIETARSGALGCTFRDGPRKRKLQMTKPPLANFHFG